MRLSGNISLDSGTKQGQGNILFHDQLTDTEHDLCMSDAHYFRISSFRRRRVKFPNTVTDELVFTVCSIPRCVRD